MWGSVIKRYIIVVCRRVGAPPQLLPSMPQAKSLDALPPELLSRTALHLVAASPRRHPSALLPLFLTCRAVYHAISLPNNPQLYKDLYFATFDYSAVLRRCQWMETHIFKDGYNILNLLSDPRLWALDYTTRWEMSRRMRQIAKLGRVEIPGVCDRRQFMQDMWTVWFLVTENGASQVFVLNCFLSSIAPANCRPDGRNLPFLLEQCNLRAALATYYRDTLLKESLQPGYPTEDGEKALVAWTCIFAGIGEKCSFFFLSAADPYCSRHCWRRHTGGSRRKDLHATTIRLCLCQGSFSLVHAPKKLYAFLFNY